MKFLTYSSLSDKWTSSLGKNGSGHFKKQWLMKNTEETKEVPDVNEVVLEELRNVIRYTLKICGENT